MIKAGDLVMVVKPTPCCGAAFGIGSVSTVCRVFVASWQCDECGREGESLMVDYGDGSGDCVSRLIKIDPPPVSVETEDEVTA